MHKIYWNIRTPLWPGGTVISFADLNTMRTALETEWKNFRWTAKEKAKVVCLVVAGILSFPPASREFELSVEEFLEWKKGYEKWGVANLKARKNQKTNWLSLVEQWLL